jgi:hypothetical protein
MLCNIAENGQETERSISPSRFHRLTEASMATILCTDQLGEFHESFVCCDLFDRIDARRDGQFRGNSGPAGTLVCNTSVELGVIVGSREALNCTFTPSVRGPSESYSGTITKLGLDPGVATRGVIVWLVYAPTHLRVGELAGTYAEPLRRVPLA